MEHRLRLICEFTYKLIFFFFLNKLKLQTTQIQISQPK